MSDWITVTQKTIDNFGGATGGFQFINTDPVRAAVWGSSDTYVAIVVNIALQHYRSVLPQ